jgi:hypothetical protein
MMWRRSLLSVVLLLSLAGCAIGGAGLGSLVAGGLQGLGGDSSGAPTNTGPFRTIDNSQTVQQLDDLASRAISQACTAEMDHSKNSESSTADGQPQASDAESVDGFDARCGYRNICLPGNTRPVRMLVCRNDSPAPTVAHAGAEETNERR